MSFLTYDTADEIISSLEIIEKLLFPETDFWHDNYLNSHWIFNKTGYFVDCLITGKSLKLVYNTQNQLNQQFDQTFLLIMSENRPIGVYLS